jgi:hypothetical protein
MALRRGRTVIIALSGRAGSGKSTVARLLGGKEISFAEPLKRFCQEVFAFTDEQVWGPSECRNAPDTRYPRADGGFLTPRHALQTLGTNWGRECYENVWVDLGIRRALACPEPLVVITDCRFVNEAKAVRAAGGEVWRVVRPGAGLAGAAGLHPSEAEQESEPFSDLVTRTVFNDGSVDQLREKIHVSRFPICDL